MAKRFEQEFGETEATKIRNVKSVLFSDAAGDEPTFKLPVLGHSPTTGMTCKTDYEADIIVHEADAEGKEENTPKSRYETKQRVFGLAAVKAIAAAVADAAAELAVGIGTADMLSSPKAPPALVSKAAASGVIGMEPLISVTVSDSLS